MAKKLKKLDPHEIDDELQKLVRDDGPLSRARELVDAAGADAPWVMVHAANSAAWGGQAELIKLFIERGVDLHDDSNFPVATAAERGHAAIITLLAAAGADPDAGSDRRDEENPDGRLPIFEAIRGGHVDAVAALIACGADVNKPSFAQRTPIDAARAAKQKKIIALLEAAGAKTVSADMLDMTGAIEANAIARVAELAKREKREVLAEGLEHACSYADREGCVAAILKHGKAKLTKRDLAVGLFWAGAVGRLPALKLMLAAGVPIDAKVDGDHALYGAAKRGEGPAIDALLAAGADVNCTTDTGKTALHAAAGYLYDKTASLVKKLLAAGADPTVRDRGGETPLDKAKKNELDAAIKLLAKATPGKQRTAKQVEAGLAKKLAPRARSTMRPVLATAKKPGLPTASRFGGCPGLLAGETWPVCEGCGAALAFFFQLDTASLPELRGHKRVIQFFFCTACEPSSSTAKDARDASLLRSVATAKLVGLGKPPKRHEPFPERPIERWSAATDYPSPQELELDVDERQALERQHLTASGTKSGGWPKWLQESRYPKGKKAKLDQLVMQLDLGGPLPYEFGDGGIGYVFARGDELGFVWQCL